MTDSYDVFLSHHSVDDAWVETLGRNLETHGYRVFLDLWSLVPGRSIIDARERALRETKKAVLVATPETVESGWVRREYEAMLKRSVRDKDFSFVPLVFGDLPDLPFIDSILCVDFRNAAPAPYREAFYRLVCGLEDRAPGPHVELDGELELPTPLPPRRDVPTGERDRFIDRIFEALDANPILMLLAQADRAEPEVIERVKERARQGYGEEHTLHVRPPYSPSAEMGKYFARLGRQCGFEEKIAGSDDWDDAFDVRLGRGERFFLIVSGFENGGDEARKEMAGTLRSLHERYGQALKVLITGGEKLAELKYAEGQLSLLNLSDELRWPELTVEDILAWNGSLTEDKAAHALGRCGGHPRLVRHYLRQEGDDSMDRNSFLWQLFTPFRGEEASRELMCRWLDQDDLGPAEPWPSSRLLRRLFWNNLLVERGLHWTWRCDVLRQAGHQALECAR